MPLGDRDWWIRALPCKALGRRCSARGAEALVGLYGKIEVASLVRRIGSEWRVEPEPYLVLLMR